MSQGRRSGAGNLLGVLVNRVEGERHGFVDGQRTTLLPGSGEFVFVEPGVHYREDLLLHLGDPGDVGVREAVADLPIERLTYREKTGGRPVPFEKRKGPSEAPEV